MLRADPTRRAPRRSVAETWFDHALLAAALFVLLVGFGTVIDGRDWRITTMLIVLMTGSTCALLRTLAFRVVAPAALVVELAAIMFIFVPQTLMVVVPTGRTFGELADLVRSAREIIIEERAPIGAAQPVVLVVAASFGLLVIVADWFLQLRRAAPLVGLLLIAVFATPALISGRTPSVWLFVVVAALWLVLLRTRTAAAGTTRRGAVPALALGTAAVVGAVLFPAVSPDVSAVATSWGKPPPQVFGRGINPMIELGQNLRRNSTAQALTYTTTAGEPQYLKVATLRDFTGRTWRPVDSRRGPSDSAFPLGADVDTERIETTISIRRLRSNLLPVPYPALPTIRGLDSRWDLLATGLTLAIPDDDATGETYTVESLEISPTAEQLRAAPRAMPEMETYLELPSRMPSVIAQTARDVTADAGTDYDRIRALQRWFRSAGGFRYSEIAPVADGFDGNGVEMIARFLEVKSGYCVHFSSSMAVMARTLGIPARIAVGYAPGSVVGDDDGDVEYEATSDDLHAWTEIYFEGVGWTRFDPTTGTGSETAFQEPAAPVTEPEPSEPTAPAPQEQAPETSTDSAAPSTSEEPRTAPRTAIVVASALLAAAAAPAVVRALRRAGRLRRGKDTVEPLWRELEDIARDFRIPVSTAETPRGFAGRLGRLDGVDMRSLEALLHRLEAARFARDGLAGGDGVADLRAVVASLRGRSTPLARLAARLLPRSLGGRPRVVDVLANETTPSTAWIGGPRA